MRPRIQFKLININSNENWRTQIQRKTKTKNFALGFALLFLHGGILACSCLISVTFIQMKALLLPCAKKKEKVKIEIDSTVEAEVEPKVESKVECDGVRN